MAQLLSSTPSQLVGQVVPHGLRVSCGKGNRIVGLDLLQHWWLRELLGQMQQLANLHPVGTTQGPGHRPAAPPPGQAKGSERVRDDLRGSWGQGEGEAEGHQLTVGAAAGDRDSGQAEVLHVLKDNRRPASTGDGAISEGGPRGRELVHGLQQHRAGITALRGKLRPVHTSKTAQVAAHAPTQLRQSTAQSRGRLGPLAIHKGRHPMCGSNHTRGVGQQVQPAKLTLPHLEHGVPQGRVSKGGTEQHQG